jgi:hypothetical protein
MSAYLIDGHCVLPDAANSGAALAAAHASRRRPLCLCKQPEPEMYVAQLGATFIVKRMPGTGSLHAPSCLSYELSGVGAAQASAITEFPETGETRLKLDFALSRTDSRHIQPCSDVAASSQAPSSRGLTLRGLLHYLWDQAGLTRWESSFAGRQSWSTVRRHLLAAADGKLAGGRPLTASLYIPEAFYVQHRDAIATRRTARWIQQQKEMCASGARRPLMLLVGELKRIAPARFGHIAVVKHVPDRPFIFRKDAYRQLVQRFGRQLSLWGASEGMHMVIIATFALEDDGVPMIENLALVPTNASWIPVEDELARAHGSSSASAARWRRHVPPETSHPLE